MSDVKTMAQLRAERAAKTRALNKESKRARAIRDAFTEAERAALMRDVIAEGSVRSIWVGPRSEAQTTPQRKSAEGKRRRRVIAALTGPVAYRGTVATAAIVLERLPAAARATALAMLAHYFALKGQA